MDDLFDACTWPPLADPYATALQDAVRFILQHFAVHGIVAAGTIVRGTPDPASDLDLYVIHAAPTRQRIQKFFNAVPAEIFVNPPAAIERYFVAEHADSRPLTAHMFATGFVVLEQNAIVTALRTQAMQLLIEPPQPSPHQITWERYAAATLYEDAVDVMARDPATADLLFSQAVGLMLQSLFRQRQQFVPRPKDLLRRTATLDPDIGMLAHTFFTSRSFLRRRQLAGELADRTLGTRGFFEWESPPERVEGTE